VTRAFRFGVVATPDGNWTATACRAATLIAHDSLVMLRGSTVEMADELQRRRDAIGASAITVNGAFLERFAPVVEMLDGR
jgi:hypothetical protein